MVHYFFLKLHKPFIGHLFFVLQLHSLSLLVFIIIIIIIIIIIYSFRVFHISVSWGFFTDSLRDTKSPQVSRTLLSILAVFNNAFIWVVSICLPTSKYSSPFNNPLVTVPKAPIAIGRIVIFMFHYYYYYYSFGFIDKKLIFSMKKWFYFSIFAYISALI